MEFFEELADRVGVKIIHGKGDFQGGPCIVNNEKVIVVNKVKPIEQRLRILARGFATMDLAGIYIVPALRAYIDEVQASLFNEEVT
ncbi:MAG: hypothetical protein GXO92_08050 [FCB group bacterium]|nr:hypothetical protein [FCB group bacterium]